MVELADHVVRHHDRYLIRRGHENVIPGGTSLKLCEHGLVGVKGIHNNPAIVFRFELGYNPCVDVITPRIDVQFRFRRATARKNTEGERTARQDFYCIH